MKTKPTIENVTRKFISQLERLARYLPYDSSTGKRWTNADISRVLIKHIDREFKYNNGRDIQDLFNLLIRQRQSDQQVRYNLDQLAEQELAQEQQDLINSTAERRVRYNRDQLSAQELIQEQHEIIDATEVLDNPRQLPMFLRRQTD